VMRAACRIQNIARSARIGRVGPDATHASSQRRADRGGTVSGVLLRGADRAY
jgi:hypothetical protein